MDLVVNLEDNFLLKLAQNKACELYIIIFLGIILLVCAFKRSIRDNLLFKLVNELYLDILAIITIPTILDFFTISSKFKTKGLSWGFYVALVGICLLYALMKVIIVDEK